MIKITAYYLTADTGRYPFAQLVPPSSVQDGYLDQSRDLPVAVGVALNSEIPSSVVCEFCNKTGCDAMLETGNEMPNNDGEFGDPYHVTCILRAGMHLSPIVPMNAINFIGNDE